MKKDFALGDCSIVVFLMAPINHCDAFSLINCRHNILELTSRDVIYE